MLELNNNGPVMVELGNDDTGNSWGIGTTNSDGFLIKQLGQSGNNFSIRNNGRVTMGPPGKLNFILDPRGNLYIDGALEQHSDRESKREIRDIECNNILDKLIKIPIHTWQYRNDPGTIRHIGPMAQDFHSAFGFGKSEKTIATVDSDGVALAAIQALSLKMDEVVRDNDHHIEKLETRIAELETMIQQQQQVLSQIQSEIQR